MGAAVQQAEGVQLPETLGVADVACAPGHRLDIARVDQEYPSPARLQDLVERDLIDGGRLNRRGLDPTGDEPVGRTMQIVSKASEGAHRLDVAVRGNGYYMKLGATSVPAAWLLTAVSRAWPRRFLDSKACTVCLSGRRRRAEGVGGKIEHFPNRDRPQASRHAISQ